MINRVILTGRLTSNVELKRTKDGTPYTFFTIAVNRRQQDQTDFISCTAWRQTAELMNNFLNKGSLIGIEGRLEVFTQQKNGQYDTRTTVQVTNITFLESKSQAEARTAEQNLNIKHDSTDNEKITFAEEPSFNQNETTPVNEKTDSFEKAVEVNAKDINLEEIKF